MERAGKVLGASFEACYGLVTALWEMCKQLPTVVPPKSRSASRRGGDCRHVQCFAPFRVWMIETGASSITESTRNQPYKWTLTISKMVDLGKEECYS